MRTARNQFDMDVATGINRGAAALAAFKAAIEKNGFLYQLGWADKTAEEVAKSELWMAVDRLVKDRSFEPIAALEAVIEDVTRRLMDDSIHESSTSAFSNATSAARARATAHWVREASYLKRHMENVERANA